MSKEISGSKPKERNIPREFILIIVLILLLLPTIF